MKKIFLVAIAFIFTFCCYGCHSATQPPLSQVETDLLASTQNLGMQKGDGKALKRYFGLNINDFEEIVIYTPSNYMDVSEILIVKARDAAQLDLVEEAVDNRVANQIQSFGSYGPEQVALLEDYEIKIIGNTLFYCVSPDAPALKDTFVKSMNHN
jgi:hypothetical protein